MEEKDPYFSAKSTGLFVDEAIRFIEAHRDQPFYINLWTLVPHAPLWPTPEELAVYDTRVRPGQSAPAHVQATERGLYALWV